MLIQPTPSLGGLFFWNTIRRSQEFILQEHIAGSAVWMYRFRILRSRDDMEVAQAGTVEEIDADWQQLHPLQHAVSDKNKLVVLVHGFTKSSSDMAFLASALDSPNYQIIQADLPTTFTRLADCVESLYLQVKPLLAQVQELHLVGHSMGGLIIREFIRLHQPQNLRTCICIATPHHGSELADWVGIVPLYAEILKPIQDLTSGYQATYFHERDFKIGVIAGTRSYGFGNFLLAGVNDGLVALNSALAEDADDTAQLDFDHLQIHQQPETAGLIQHFIAHGSFR